MTYVVQFRFRGEDSDELEDWSDGSCWETLEGATAEYLFWSWCPNPRRIIKREETVIECSE